MTFIPYCGKTPVELGIEDEQGNVDLLKFKEHIEVCTLCKRFLPLLGKTFIVDMISALGSTWKVKQG